MTGVELIWAERDRQIKKLGWTAKHDDSEHDEGELAVVAALYATPVRLYHMDFFPAGVEFKDPWPDGWDEGYDKRPVDRLNTLRDNAVLPAKARIKQLAKAGALIAAEIDRLQRAMK